MGRYLPLWMVVLVALGCGGTAGTTAGSSDEAQEDDSTSDEETATSGGSSTTLSTGEQVVFGSFGSSESETMNVGGTAITISAGASYLHRYQPSAVSTTAFSAAVNSVNNYSCDNAGDQRAYVVGQRLYNLEICPDIEDGESVLTVEQVDPNDGSIVDSGCRLNVRGSSFASLRFAIVDGTMYYYTTGGDLVRQALATCTSNSGETTLVTSGSDTYVGELFNVNDRLIAVHDDVSADTYTIVERDLESGAVTAELLEFTAASSDPTYSFYAGDDALYWTIYDADELTFSVMRYPLAGNPASLYSATVDDSMIAQALAASGGDVLVAYRYVAQRTESGYATAWTTTAVLHDVSTEQDSALALGDFFESYLQLLVVE